MTADPTKIALHLDPREQRMNGVTAHGNLPFSVPFMTEIIPGLWQGGCTTGLILPDNIKHLVSLYPWEQYQVRHELTTQMYVTAYDDVTQGMAQLENVAQYVAALWLERSGDILVHCQAGLNRSSLVVGLVLAHLDWRQGVDNGDYVKFIREKRSYACLCNPAFESFLNGGC